MRHLSINRLLPTTSLILTLLAAATLLVSCSKPLSQLERIKKRGELIVLTRNSPTTYYEGPNGPAGLEYDLAVRFAEQLGVKLRIEVPENLNQILQMVDRGEGDLAAAGLTITNKRKKKVRFGLPYQTIVQQLVYRNDGIKPKNIDDLAEGVLEVVASSSHVERLQALRREHPGLMWNENSEQESDELLYLIWQRLIDFTIADSNEFAQNQRFYPELRAAFDISEPEKLGWALRLSTDDSLYDEVIRFFTTLKKSGELEHLLDRYYGHTKRFDYVDTRTFLDQSEVLLPKYQPLFEAAAKRYNFDWRLLAATSYQESHWDPKARSPTGVRGLMMLTLATAKQIGVKSRLDPEQSVMGGAKYLRQLIDRLPDGIKEPDRTWMALAAYNIGYGHLEDAGTLAERRNDNPTLWVDIKKSLPLLNKRKWYSTVKYGYARGRAPLHYVRNIRRYYDLLVKATTEVKEPVPEAEHDALTITTPTL
ncbi:lytic transglycosylase F [Solemya pervernicosa gill symbiont]|uniref:Membrane-bound lytic murein transglycosylase F n=2 Tax=Gammaproteobacteria incertae sedis TaxID=118884 RepID=A0A1T2L1W5_9GAMM|nr:membrane-bound lytic murein transglycosylase MltF [Candidatus Reidiella endopervernicosa]OOZ39087.1 lytic transglycosylase F [Solemya pervernicosa gill symbiont]QKQ27190.1 membrane-bound lytic murein transglycosylase MltF [Candidatus Reidiella endopervernicosa]